MKAGRPAFALRMECAEASLQEPSLGFLAGQAEGPLIGLSSLLGSSQSTAEFGSGRMGQVIPCQFAAI